MVKHTNLYKSYLLAIEFHQHREIIRVRNCFSIHKIANPNN